MENLELRNVELRATEDRTISGTAIVFNQKSRLIDGQFFEIIKPGAITQELINNSTILLLWNHQSDAIPLAKWNKGKGTLNVVLTATGVNFSFIAKSTQEEIFQAVKSGDVSECSFAFTVEKNGDSFQKLDNGKYLRTVNKISGLYDLSLVNLGAYSQTSCRSLESFKANFKEAFKSTNEQKEYFKYFDNVIAGLKN